MKPKKKPELDLKDVEQKMIDEVCSYYKNSINLGSKPSIRETALKFGISAPKVRKLLITGGAYTSAKADQIRYLYNKGMDTDEIAAEMNMTRACVSSYLPYSKTIYGMNEKSVDADRMTRYRARKIALNELKRVIAGAEPKEDDRAWQLALWKCIMAYQNVTFSTVGQGKQGIVNFSYCVKVSSRTGKPTNEIIISRRENGRTITRSTVNLALKKAIDVQRTEGSVKGPKKLGTFGSSYLYSIFLSWGIIRRTEMGESDAIINEGKSAFRMNET